MPFIKMVLHSVMLVYVLLFIPQYIMTSFHVSNILPYDILKNPHIIPVLGDRVKLIHAISFNFFLFVYFQDLDPNNKNEMMGLFSMAVFLAAVKSKAFLG